MPMFSEISKLRIIGYNNAVSVFCFKSGAHKPAISVELRNSDVNEITPSCLTFTGATISRFLFQCNFWKYYLNFAVACLLCYSLVLSHIFQPFPSLMVLL